MSPITNKLPDPMDGVGMILAGGSTAALGLAAAVARYAYDGGANGLAVATSRVTVSVVGLALFCLLTRRRLWLGRRGWLHCLGLGVLATGMTYGNVGAVEFIPVGLAALLFYTFPPMVALGEAVLARRWPALPKLLAVAIAFAGLTAMLGVSLGASDGRGIGLASLAAVSCAANGIWLARTLTNADPFVISLHMTIVASVVLLVACAVTGGARFPVTDTGWGGLVGVVLLQGAALPLYFMAIMRVGALKCATIANVQPVTSIIAAYFLFAEVLSPVQFTGGALVVFGIWLMQRHDRRMQSPPVPTSTRSVPGERT
ncbi:MAG: DMT family transporter [Gammaproteobacteria bacterium]